jgi:hypothetical protein
MVHPSRAPLSFVGTWHEPAPCAAPVFPSGAQAPRGRAPRLEAVYFLWLARRAPSNAWSSARLDSSISVSPSEFGTADVGVGADGLFSDPFRNAADYVSVDFEELTHLQ